MDDGSKQLPQARPLKRALELVTEAMDLLDAHGASPHGAAHLAMARQAIEDDLKELK